MAFKLENINGEQGQNQLKKDFDINSILKTEITFFSNSFSNKLKENFYTELSVLLNAGIDLRKSLVLLENTHKKQNTKSILNSFVKKIESGVSFSEVLSQQKEFTDYEYYSVKIGEEIGTLEKVCEQLGVFFSRKNEQRRHIISALTYPVIILSTAFLVVLFMLQFVVPMFQDIFKQQNVDLPGITSFIIDCSAFIKNYGSFIFIFLILLFIINMFFNKRKQYKRLKDTLVLYLPYIGNFIKTVYMSQFTQAVTLLTASKVPVVNSIQLVKQMISFYPMQIALERVEKQLLKGDSLSDSLQQHAIFDDKMIAMIKVAEETNQTEFIFKRLNEQYNIQVMQRSKLLATVMEPFIILIVGVFVGVILIAMYLPMFKLSSVLG